MVPGSVHAVRWRLRLSLENSVHGPCLGSESPLTINPFLGRQPISMRGVVRPSHARRRWPYHARQALIQTRSTKMMRRLFIRWMVALLGAGLGTTCFAADIMVDGTPATNDTSVALSPDG